MKYIKTYEDHNTIEKGDFVRLKYKTYPERQTHRVWDVDVNRCKVGKQGPWISRDLLEKVPEHELDAKNIMYNEIY